MLEPESMNASQTFIQSTSASEARIVRVGVLGARGKVGAEVCRAIASAPDLSVVAQIGRGDPLDALVTERVQVAVDFTEPSATERHLSFLIARGIHAVVGTTGLEDALLESVAGRLLQAPDVGVLVAPNFALGAVLAMRFAEQAAPYFESVELIELHHPFKKDAPSGTALETAKRLASARRRAGVGGGPDATEQGVEAARGARVDGVRVHAVRLAGLVSHQEALFGNSGEVLSIRHDSIDRSSFAAGVLLAVRRIGDYPGLTIGLEKLLDF